MSQTGRVTTVEQKTFIVPELTVKDLLGAIPAHCFKRSALKSSLYIVGDVMGLASAFAAGSFTQSLLDANRAKLPYSEVLYPLARFSIWTLYGFVAGLFATGLWVIAHECGHQAFSESKFINNTVGWVLHSALGVPYHSWRISHGKHHASTGHMTQDQVWVPKTRSQFGLPPLDPEHDDVHGSSVTDKAKNEMYEALGDSPIGAVLGVASYCLIGWPAYIASNASGQYRYPKGTNHFSPSAIIFAPHQYHDVVVSVIGVLLWLGGLAAWGKYRGFTEVLRLYVTPYLWMNHWLVLITFLQHTDPLLPHYRSESFTFARGALCTLDRKMFGDLGSVAAWIGATTMHGISETHVVHHTSSKIPHYNAWDAKVALDKVLRDAGYNHEGGPMGWAEMYRVYRACKFVEDEGQVVFYKDAYGLAAARPIFSDTAAAVDSGIDMSK